jgi:hypothetical protein
LGWNPHPWFHLVETEKEARYISALTALGGQLYLMIGGQTYLDRWAEQFWPAASVSHSFAPGPFQQLQNKYLNIIGDFVIEVTLDPLAVKAIDAIYITTTKKNPADIGSIVDIFNGRYKCKLKLERNHTKARRLRRQFERFWGKDFD